MGQFYQTTAPEFLSNKMFKLPAELMADVLMNKEKVVDADIAAAREFEKLKAQGLAPDDPYIKSKLAEYEAETNAIVEGIKGNVMDYGKFNDRTRKLSNDVHREWNSGGIAKIEANRLAYTNYVAKLDEAAKKTPGDFPPELLANLKAGAMQKFAAGGGTGYNKDTGTYGSFSGDDALALGNLPDRLNENVGKYIKPNSGETVSMGSDGRWMVTDKRGTKEISADRLKQAAFDYIKASPDITSALQQRQTYGVQGFEDPNAYLQNTIDSFVSTNQFRETTRDLSNKLDDYGKAADDDRREKEKDALDPITYFSQDVIQTTGGNSLASFNSSVEANNKQFQDSKMRGLKKMSDEMGYKSDAEFKAKNPAAWNRLAKGDFSDIENLPGGKEIANQHRQAKYARAGLNALEAQFKNENKQSKTDNLPLFNKWMAERGTTVVDITQGWNDFDPNMTKTKLKSINDQFFNDQRYLTSVMNIEKGTTVNVGGKNVDIGGKGYTMNQLIDLGVVKPVPVKMASGITTVEGLKNKDGKSLGADVQTIQYELTDGTGTIGFDVSKGIVPSTSYNDDSKIELSFVANIKGKRFQASVTDAKTQSMINYDNNKSGILKTRLQLQKWSNSGPIEIPDTGGMIYYSNDVTKDGKVIYKKGELTMNVDGKKVTVNTSTPKVLQVLSEFMFK